MIPTQAELETFETTSPQRFLSKRSETPSSTFSMR